MKYRRVHYETQLNENKRIQAQLLGSKYIANRLIFIAALSDKPSILHNVPDNNDINFAVQGLRQLGAVFERKDSSLICRQPIDPNCIPADVKIYAGASGTFSRFVTAVSALLINEKITITADDKMSTRPMGDLVCAIEQLGVTVEHSEQRLPITLQGLVKHNNVALRGNVSSQYISGLLLAAPLFDKGLTINLEGEIVSKPYIQLTMDLMSKAGVKPEWNGNSIVITGKQKFQQQDYHIPPDPVSASYFLGLGMLTQRDVHIANFDPDICQGETSFYQVLTDMGAQATFENNGLTVIPPKEIKGGQFDMGDMPDVVQTLCMVATKATSPVVITNVAHLAFKESNRIEDTANEMRKLGVNVKTTSDSMTVYPCDSLLDAMVNTYDDHRMAMSLALLASQGIDLKIVDADVVNKSFPIYWQVMATFGLNSEEVESSSSNDLNLQKEDA